MAELLNAYQRNEINRVEKILKENKQEIMGDPFIEQFINNILREIRTKVLIELIRPYTRLTIPFIAKVTTILVCLSPAVCSLLMNHALPFSL